ncbi:uncharacterized protein LOC119605856 isoform X2 [Lucilia sericata]|uniref:uncharacterized protein LOC119605856 isoform X2 n=1 Tax=Lucilia sericata TaxID=13632 RepID=UPI0018A7F12F|nr:uncharacterized protein LOC119605856 isoform X2 [Lucilia sericata]
MYKKLEQNLNSVKTERQKNLNNNNLKKTNTMNLQSEYCSANHLQQQQKQQLLPDFLNQSFQEKNRINCILRNKHSRTSKNTTATWLRSLSLFKTKCRQEHQQRQQQHQHINNSNKQSWSLLTTIIVLLAIIENSMSLAKADDNFNNNVDDVATADDFNITATTIPLTTLHYHHHLHLLNDNSNVSTDGGVVDTQTSTFAPIMANNESLWFDNTTNSSPTTTNSTSNTTSSSSRSQKKFKTKYNTAEDSIFLRFAKRFTADNNLWSGIIQDCYRRPTFSCFQKNVYYYLNDVLDAQDVNVTQRLKFYKNDNSYQYDVEEAEDVPTPTTQSSLAVDSMENVAAEEENDIKENEIPYARNSRSFTDIPTVAETPIEEVTNALYGKSIKFAMTHDIELKLPEMMFDGATFRISPQAIEGNGVIAKLELIPKQQSEARLAGKILMKKIQKFLKSKLLLSFLALVLIIKIIKIKLFWLLPLVIGVGAAKKLLLKFLLFLFPALSHLFKLCSYYQQTYHSTKYHHHHHHINHHHTVVPAWHSAENSHIPEIIYTHPPKGHVSAYLHGAPIHESYGPPSHEHFETGWANSGPGLGSDFFNSKYRNNIAAAQSAPSPVYTPARQPSLPPLQNQLKPQQIQAALTQAAQIAAQYDPTRNQEQQQAAGGQSLQPQQQLTPELSAQLKEAIRIQAEQRLVQQQQQILDKQPFVQDGQPLMPLNYDPFYSPILLKIDKIVEQLGVTDDLCKERLVCSMYKDPQRYSPHSNFVSAELSRDTNELQPITNTNQAVVRFFRLIQAARDGQDQRDCLALYPNCSINTE